MTTYTIDTNAGPIITHEARSAAAVRKFVEKHVPLLDRRGYSSRWERVGRWHVLHVLNSKGREVHACAFRAGSMRASAR